MDAHMTMGHAHHEHGNHMNMNHMMPTVDHDMSMNSSFQDDIIANTFNGSDDSIDYKSDLRIHAQHHGHAGHEGHAMADNGGGHDMAMTFHGGYNEVILFSWWKVTDIGEFIGSFFAVFLMALLYEGLKYYRKHLLWKTYTGLQYCAVSPPDKGVANLCAPDEPQVIQPVPHVLERNVPTMMSTAHAWQTVLHGLQVLVSYMLMLVFMSYNTWLCAAVVLGSATGYFLFGWRESVVVDFTEHCH
ncbi:high affinity copper uptake protein 1 isoform X1 [Spodoptera frugiperda]|uniref:Copper transport protein n=1 Tax=Spodoptera frugiperda TaxID=7108 RepID=A0A9R0EY47_SPOFR|nr:high affinity copper uptake protein 1 isoform X1 [Spodoptera frugiperda]XP_035430403.1 high affinity copper uptake protein 1 isoform X1 [Spodoptera frugiperda]XP_050553483.1 high affinity copper uptake protein 1 isoform X1 [Spodoptera frugiperda]XP_050553484.1 high affinity copper uptake protein 1 isoform X1 [Spodoptera frugiperda]XP_050553485.1 high affinity copper uptake protein 1 isoform X1 [Spodoptera frugiperda]